MNIISTIDKMQKKSSQIRSDNKIIAFVPTMGFLHEGHLSLIKKAKEVGDIVVVSIFVNPTQFGPNEDLDKYPHNFERDRELCQDAGADFIFYPEVNEIYPETYFTYVEVHNITHALCGLSRPEHFKGVTTIVTKLFNIVKPHKAIFGQKDFQQSQVIKRMVSDLNMDIEIIRSPIIREADGIAMSSRNKYLSESERKDALVLSKSLLLAKDFIKIGKLDSIYIKDKMIKLISSVPSQIDYVEIVDADTLKEVEQVKNNTLFALAVKIGKTRLIDNLYIENLNKEETWQ